MKRENVIIALSVEWVEYALSNDDPNYLDTISLEGFKGFRSYTDAELEQEYETAFGDKVSIK